MKKLNFHTSRLIIIIAFLVAIISISNSCTKSSMDNTYGTGGGGGGGTGGPGANEVWIQDYSFTPSSITVTAGTTVTWTNKGAITHTVTSNTGVFDSGNISTGGVWSYKFSTTGTFPYHCTIHPSMTGSVVVTAASAGTGGY